MREEFEKIFRHIELGDIKKEAYGLVFVFESGNQATFDIVFFYSFLSKKAAEFTERIYQAETGPERTSKNSILTYKMIVENKSDMNKAKKKIDDAKLNRGMFKPYNVVDRKLLSAKYERGKINQMMLELVRKIHDDKNVKTLNKAEQLIPDEAKNNAKKKKVVQESSSCCGARTAVEDVFLL